MKRKLLCLFLFSAVAVLNYQKTSNPTVTVVNLNNWTMIVQDCFFRTIKLASSDT